MTKTTNTGLASAEEALVPGLQDEAAVQVEPLDCNASPASTSAHAATADAVSATPEETTMGRRARGGSPTSAQPNGSGTA